MPVSKRNYHRLHYNNNYLAAVAAVVVLSGGAEAIMNPHCEQVHGWLWPSLADASSSERTLRRGEFTE